MSSKSQTAKKIPRKHFRLYGIKYWVRLQLLYWWQIIELLSAHCILRNPSNTIISIIDWRVVSIYTLSLKPVYPATNQLKHLHTCTTRSGEIMHLAAPHVLSFSRPQTGSIIPIVHTTVLYLVCNSVLTTNKGFISGPCAD